jgi:hypothetical protein
VQGFKNELKNISFKQQLSLQQMTFNRFYHALLRICEVVGLYSMIKYQFFNFQKKSDWLGFS